MLISECQKIAAKQFPQVRLRTQSASGPLRGLKPRVLPPQPSTASWCRARLSQRKAKTQSASKCLKVPQSARSPQPVRRTAAMRTSAICTRLAADWDGVCCAIHGRGMWSWSNAQLCGSGAQRLTREGSSLRAAILRESGPESQTT